MPSADLRVSIDGADLILSPNENSPYVLATGAGTDFVWNLIGQNRATLLLSLQSKVSPFDFARRMFVDAPNRLNEAVWARRQGAWLLRRIKDDPPRSNLPWYISNIAVRAFTPLGDKGAAFDVAGTRWFPLVKYASQLHLANELIVQNGELEFSGSSGTERYPRRFAVRLTAAHTGATAITIDARKALGARNLKFGWQYELAGELPRTLALRIQRDATQIAPNTPPEDVEELLALYNRSPLRTASLDLNNPATGRVRLEFDGLRTGDIVWIYELNVIADEWDW